MEFNRISLSAGEKMENNTDTRCEKWHTMCGKGKHRVEATGNLISNDLLVTIPGGTAPHIGAIAIAIPRPSLKDPNLTSSTSSVYTRTSHKDGIIARKEAESLAGRLNRVVVVTAGVHIDRATITDINKLTRASRDYIEQMLQQILGFLKA